jgi:hypothetical protein
MTDEEAAALFAALAEGHRKTWEEVNGPLPADWNLDVPFDDGTTPRQRQAEAASSKPAQLLGAQHAATGSRAPGAPWGDGSVSPRRSPPPPAGGLQHDAGPPE